MFVEDIALEREVEGDVLLTDMGQGCPFRAGTFDGAISVSALQWLCNADRSSHKPVQRLYKFFSTLYACLVHVNLAAVMCCNVWVTESISKGCFPVLSGK
jgi:hypothetical protein